MRLSRCATPRFWMWTMNIKSQAFFLLPFLVLSCSETPTSLRVHLVYEKSWSLDQIEISIADLDDKIEITSELTLILPAEVTGQLQTLQVVAYRGEERFAYGETEVIPLLGQEVQATVTLTRLPCGAWCHQGQTECRSDGVVICEQRDDDHCFEWSQRVPCPQETPFCSLGQCSSRCVNECAEGEKRCAGSGAFQICGENDSDSCTEWMDAEPCEDGQVCSAGTCATGCVDECVAGSVECLGANQRSCNDRNRDGCSEWSPPTACPIGESCSEGRCAPNEECINECSESECAELRFHECGQFDLDPCLDRSPGTSCVSSDGCLQGQCTPEGCSEQPRVCNNPGEPICVDDNTLRVFDGNGSCDEGECSYSSRDLECPNCMVVGGVPNCETETCGGASCNTPPEPMICYQPIGVCIDGLCNYAFADGLPCDDGNACHINTRCESGICSGGEPIVCADAPEPTCIDDSTLRVFNAQGQCDEGECNYTHVDIRCFAECHEDGDVAACLDGSGLLQDLGGPLGFGPGSFPMDASDDHSSDEISLTSVFPNGLSYFGNHEGFFVNENGNISFGAPSRAFTPQFPSNRGQPTIAAYFADVDIRGAEGSTNGGRPGQNNIHWYVGDGRVVVTWHNVGYYNREYDLLNSFQLVLTNRTDVAPGDFDVDFRYERCEWTTGGASGGENGFGGTPAYAGFDAANGTDALSLPGSGTMSVLDLCTTSNIGIAGIWHYQVRNGRFVEESEE